jgi:hypothetical protein
MLALLELNFLDDGSIPTLDPDFDQQAFLDKYQIQADVILPVNLMSMYAATVEAERTRIAKDLGRQGWAGLGTTPSTVDL